MAVGYGDSDGGGSDREHEDNGRQELSDRQYAGLPQEEKDSTVDFSIPILAQMVFIHLLPIANKVIFVLFKIVVIIIMIMVVKIVIIVMMKIMIILQC